VTKIAVYVGLLALMALPALGQQPAEQQQDLDRMAAEQKLQERVAFFQEMGMESEVATMLAILTEAGMDPAQLALMVTMGARGGGEAMLPMLMMNSMRGGGAQSPAMVERDGRLFIAEGGKLYIIDEATMEVVSTLEYARKPAPEDSPIWSLLGPMIAGARGQAQQTACQGNLKQLGLGFLMYAQDHDGWLPDEENWVEAVYPYIKNRAIFTCPSRPDQPVGYALNEAVLALRVNDLANPSQQVLAFETLEGGEAPLGGAELVPPEGIHEGGIGVLFADGHVQWVRADEAVRLLQPQ